MEKVHIVESAGASKSRDDKCGGERQGCFGHLLSTHMSSCYNAGAGQQVTSLCNEDMHSSTRWATSDGNVSSKSCINDAREVGVEMFVDGDNKR